MAMALIREPSNNEELEKLSEVSLSFIKEALTLEENGHEKEALLHYEEGLRLLDRALAIPPEENMSDSECHKSAMKKTQMSRTRQQIIFRIHELRTKYNLPPSDPDPDELIKCLNPEKFEKSDESQDETLVPYLPSDAEILFTIAGKVQVFYINAEGKVSAPCYPSSLFIFKFKSEDSAAFLKVGEWVYPLVPGKSPILRSNEGAYMFPDLDENIIGNAIGLILPDDILDVEKADFEAILSALTAAPSNELKEYDECLEYSSQVSAGLIKGAEVVGRGMVKGAIKSSEWMYIGAEKLKDKINPENQPKEVDPRLKKSLGAARWISGYTVKASGFLVSKAGAASVALGRFLAPHVKNQSAKALSYIIEQSDEKSQKQLDIASELASGTLTALSTVYSALENSSRILATNIANNTVQVVSHK